MLNLKLIIDHFEDEKVILKDGDELIAWPKSKLPENLDQKNIIFRILSEEEANSEREDQAKKILNEIMS